MLPRNSIIKSYLTENLTLEDNTQLAITMVILFELTHSTVIVSEAVPVTSTWTNALHWKVGSILTWNEGS